MSIDFRAVDFRAIDCRTAGFRTGCLPFLKSPKVFGQMALTEGCRAMFILRLIKAFSHLKMLASVSFILSFVFGRAVGIGLLSPERFL